jgi:tRNA A37 threonylcarbamoyladenosine synthetase subunit TsaC/SUA5/YrdC
MPSNRIALELLSETGPLAASQAAPLGAPTPATAAGVKDLLGESVAVYLADDDAVGQGLLSTVIDASSLDRPRGRLRLVREGAISREDIFEVVSAENFG